MIWTNILPSQTRLNRPEVNTFETDENFNLELALPGWKKSEVQLEVDGDLLLVKGERVFESEPNYRRREFGLTSFEKSFHLPDTIDIDSIGATREQGVLHITLPKVAEAQPVRKAIPVA